MCTVAVKVCIVVVVLIMLRVHLCCLAVVTVVTAVVTVVTAVGTFGTVVLGLRLLTLQYLQTFRSGNEVRGSASFLHLVQVAIVTGFRHLILVFHQTFTDLHFFRRVSLHQLLTFPHFHSTQHLFFFQD